MNLTLEQGPCTNKGPAQGSNVQMPEVNGQRSRFKRQMAEVRIQRYKATKVQSLTASKPLKRFLRASEAKGQIRSPGRPPRHRLPLTFLLPALGLSGCLSNHRPLVASLQLICLRPIHLQPLASGFRLLAPPLASWPPGGGRGGGGRRPLTLSFLPSVSFPMHFLPTHLHRHAFPSPPFSISPSCNNMLLFALILDFFHKTEASLVYNNKVFSFVFQISDSTSTFEKRTEEAKGYGICFGTFDNHRRSQRLWNI